MTGAAFLPSCATAQLVESTAEQTAHAQTLRANRAYCGVAARASDTPLRAARPRGERRGAQAPRVRVCSLGPPRACSAEQGMPWVPAVRGQQKPLRVHCRETGPCRVVRALLLARRLRRLGRAQRRCPLTTLLRLQGIGHNTRSGPRKARVGGAPGRGKAADPGAGGCWSGRVLERAGACWCARVSACSSCAACKEACPKRYRSCDGSRCLRGDQPQTASAGRAPRLQLAPLLASLLGPLLYPVRSCMRRRPRPVPAPLLRTAFAPGKHVRREGRRDLLLALPSGRAISTRSVGSQRTG